VRRTKNGKEETDCRNAKRYDISTYILQEDEKINKPI
jgi:hypothetical protein